MGKPALNITNFEGAVVLNDWMRFPDGRIYSGFCGQVTIYSDVEAVGFEAKGHNSANWLARIQGPTSSVNVLGCQVRGVIEGPAARPEVSSDFLTVP